MFTLKFYGSLGGHVRIVEAESLTILKDRDGAEITLHQKDGNDFRMDVTKVQHTSDQVIYDSVIIENSTGKTTEIIYADPGAYKAAPKAA